MLIMNQVELKQIVEDHCGDKIKRCIQCEKKLSRARTITRQIDNMWWRYNLGYFQMTDDEKKRFDIIQEERRRKRRLTNE